MLVLVLHASENWFAHSGFGSTFTVTVHPCVGTNWLTGTRSGTTSTESTSSNYYSSASGCGVTGAIGIGATIRTSLLVLCA